MRVALWVTLTFARAGATPSPVNECAPLLEEIERELEIALVLRHMDTGAYDRDGSWRDSRQGARPR